MQTCIRKTNLCCVWLFWEIDKAEPGRFSILQVKATSSEESSPPVDAGKLFSDLKEKVKSKPGTIPKKRKLETILMEDKSTVILYGGGAIVAVWLSSIFIGAINSMPLLPKLMELVRLGYTGWFVYRYLLFKDSRKEIATDIEALKKFPGTE
ncbi:hypothetical protein HYC85_015234 [Camellia sinensis]|uniref:Cyanobacterial aminoacyl-tRNA synthetase CAAD domain-containing protein n=1 Tax=Camellia sinensis TaxID=4442 RepID=A0A7J7GZV4_CAMSI|nr:hypothetical protein HYC85_015234 [Camellia sinensis]